ncbi:MAG: AYWB SAP09-like protein [Periwinkle leaf yellowing phytoplasma]|nr:MAG: AYWB SAP09-like protein [Periwinkle leaf yellowing phytoplasma]
MDINVPLYLKISTKYDTLQTFTNPEKYLNVGLKVDNNDYDDTKRPQIRLNDKGIGSLKIQISIEQKEIITNKNPQLELICDYELVDSQGTAYSGSSQTIENKITNLA